ncbi:MAG: hypothetical protein WKG07_16950 [Hymenobacter sp.]
MLALTGSLLLAGVGSTGAGSSRRPHGQRALAAPAAPAPPPTPVAPAKSGPYGQRA